MNLERRLLLHSAAVSMGLASRLDTLDLFIVLGYLAGITWFGLRFHDGARSLKGYFLADSSIPWWAISLSIVAAETSTLTIISIPGLSYTGDFSFLQVVLGYLLGRVVVCIVLLPRYFRGEMMTAYQLIGQRFGSRLHQFTAGLFLILRAVAEGVRVFAVSIVVGIAIGTSDVLSIAIICGLTLLYTLEGGLAAVIWTDVVQMGIYVLGTLATLWTVKQQVPGGWPVIHQVASAAGKFTIFHFAVNLTQAYTFWAGLVGGCFLTMASHGVDQLMVQRLLAARSLRAARAALLTSGLFVLMQFFFFLMIGAGLYAYDAGQPYHAITAPDRIFPIFIVQHMPRGLAGLMIAAILAAAMSNLSAAVNSLTSTSVVDFYLRLKPLATHNKRASISRLLTVCWAGLLFALAILSRTGGHVVEAGLSIASVAYGALLGVFLLGTLAQRANEVGAMVGMFCGLVVNIVLWRQQETLRFHGLVFPKVAWTWFVAIGALLTTAIGYLASMYAGRKPDSKENI